MALFGDPTKHLSELGKQLTCPICLNLLKTAVNLTCNHIFCRSCISEATKTASCCPVCKIPTSKREIRGASHMDSMVTVYRQMEAAAGVEIHCTQPSQLAEVPPEASESPKREGVDNIRDKAVKLRETRVADGGSDPETDKSVSRKTGKSCVPGNSLAKAVATGDGLKFSPALVTDSVRIHDKETGRQVSPVVGKGILNTPKPDQNLLTASNAQTPSLSSPSGGGPARVEDAKGEKTQGCKIGRTLKGVDGQIRETMEMSGPDPSTSTRSRKLCEGVKEPDGNKSDHVSKANERASCVSQAEKQGSQAMPLKKSLTAGTWCLVGCQNGDGKGLEKNLPEQSNLLRKTGAVGNETPLKSQIVKGDKSEPFKMQETERDTEETNETVYFTGDEMTDAVTNKSSPKTPINHEREPRCIGKGQEAQEDVSNVRNSSDNQGNRRLASAVKGWLMGGSQNQDDSSKSGLLNQIDDIQNCTQVSPAERFSLNLSQIQQTPITGVVDRANDGRADAVKDNKPVEGVKKAGKHVVEEFRKPKPTQQGVVDSQPDWLYENPKKSAEAKKETAMYVRRREMEAGPADETKPLVSVSGGPYQRESNLEKGKRKRDGKSDGAEGFSRQKSAHGSVCSFCGTSETSEVTGEMIQVDCKGGRILRGDMSVKRHRIQLVGEIVHENCLEWAPDVYFQGEKVRNLAAELQRAQRLRCTECTMKGAALGCCVPKCKRTYHYPCARKVRGCRWDEDHFIMLCPEHASLRFPREDSEGYEMGSEVKREPSTQITKRSESYNGGKWSHGSASKWVLCASGLNSSAKDNLAQFAAMVGGSYLKQWSPAVTHMITGVDEDGRVRRTVKFLSAILSGQWVVSEKWVTACKKGGKPVNEENFEVKMDVHDMAGGPRRGRMLMPQKLFEGITLHFFGEFETPSKEDLSSVFLVGGGSILHRKPTFPFDNELPRPNSKCTPPLIILFNDINGLLDTPRKYSAAISVQKSAKKLAMEVRGCALPHIWLLDSAAKCEILPIEKYMVRESI